MGLAMVFGRAVEVRAEAMRVVENEAAGTIDGALVTRDCWNVYVEHAAFVDGDFHRLA
jgi:hypothetical protein